MNKNKPTGTIIWIPTNKLFLDKENPRFIGTNGGSSQNEIAKTLWQDMYLDELLLSIAVNGYYVQEPLLVVKKGTDDYVVIEGNRRLATIKILLDPVLAKYVGARTTDMPKLTQERITSLSQLPAIEFSDRLDLWSYLTFRHINGPRSWSSLSKAEYVAHLHQKKGLTFDLILKSMGDKNRLTIKLYNALMILRQGESITRFSREDIYSKTLNFSHLYTIISYPTTQVFLGINKHKQSEAFPENPVPVEKKKELEDLLTWIFGSKSLKQPSLIKSQNPDIRMLDDIIGNRGAVMYLREGHDLKSSYELTEKENIRFENYIARAEISIRNAKGLDDTYKGDLTLKTKVKSIIEIATDISNKMEKYSKKG